MANLPQLEVGRSHGRGVHQRTPTADWEIGKAQCDCDSAETWAAGGSSDFEVRRKSLIDFFAAAVV